MRAIVSICCASSLTCLLLLAASQLDSTSPSTVARSTKPGASRSASAPAAVLGSHARAKVVQYFDTFRTEPLGLPRVCAAAIKVEKVPASWTTSGISAGKVVQASERPALVEAPAELVRVLPVGHPAVRYFLAGSNLVAVDSGFKVVDSIRIPTVSLPIAESEPLQLVGHVVQRGR